MDTNANQELYEQHSSPPNSPGNIPTESAEPKRLREPDSHDSLPDGRKLNEYGEYEFDSEFEESLIALVARDKDFFAKYGHLIKDEYFSTQRARDLFLAVTEYQDKYGKEMDKPILKNEVRERYAKFRNRDDSLEEYLAAVDRMFDLDIQRMAEYAADKVIGFARRRQLKINIRKLAENVMGAEDELEECRGLVEGALDIGKVSTTQDILNSLPTFNDLDENKPVDWLVEKLIPAKSIIAIYGKRGLGKTHVVYRVAKCVQEGEDFFGFEVKQMPVYWLDYENPEDVRCHVKKVCGGSNVKMWALDNPISPPPKFHKEKWEVLKSFPPGLIIIDTFRASQEKNTQDDTDMAVIMNHLKELWASGHTVIILLHTLKLDDKKWKGNTVILDLADHSLALYRVREAGETEEIEDEDLNKPKLLFFGTQADEKSRYSKHKIYLRFDPEKGIGRVDDPDEAILRDVSQKFWEWVENEKSAKGELTVKDYPNKTKFEELVKGWGYGSIAQKIIKKGLPKYWATDKDEKDRKRGQSVYYFPVKKVPKE